jgi:hypothetical protein
MHNIAHPLITATLRIYDLGPPLYRNSMNKNNSDTQICRSFLFLPSLKYNTKILLITLVKWKTHRIFLVFNKNAFSVFLSSLDHCLLATVLLSRQRIVTMAPQISSFSMMRNNASHDKAVQLKCIHVQRQR